MRAALRMLGLGGVLVWCFTALAQGDVSTDSPSDEAPASPDLQAAPEKPVKPRIRRDSKIIENLQKVETPNVDGVQASQSTMQLRLHLTRMAELEFIGELARKNEDVDLGARVNELLRLERRRYKNAVKRLKRYTRMKTQVGIP